MKVVINGKDADIPKGETLAGYVASRGLSPQAVVIELNESVVPRDKWESARLSEGDRVEIVSFVGGG